MHVVVLENKEISNQIVLKTKKFHLGVIRLDKNVQQPCLYMHRHKDCSNQIGQKKVMDRLNFITHKYSTEGQHICA